MIDEKDGTTKLLSEALVTEYRTFKEQGLTIQANDLLVPYTDSNRTPVGMNYFFLGAPIRLRGPPCFLDAC